MEKKKQKRNKNVMHRTTELLPLLRINDRGYIETKTGILDVFQILPKNIKAANMDEQERAIYLLTLFYRSYKDDFKIVSLNYPTVTTQQQEHIRYAISQTENETYKYYLKQMLYELKDIETRSFEREYYFFVFANSVTDYEDKLMIIDQQLGQVLTVEEIDTEKKEKILFKMNNLNSRIIIG